MKKDVWAFPLIKAGCATAPFPAPEAAAPWQTLTIANAGREVGGSFATVPGVYPRMLII